MKKYLFLILVVTGFISCNQKSKSKPEANDKSVAVNNVQPDKNAQIDKNIHSRLQYSDPAEKQVIIENGFPQGGIRYIDPAGNVGGYALFTSRIVNETDYPLELQIGMPSTSYEISNFPGKYFRVLVPADTMTEEEISLPFHGLTEIKPFLDSNIRKPCVLQRTILPKQASGFYFIMLIMTEHATGMTRAALSLKEQKLIYKISRYSSTKPITLIDEIEIPCGSINLKNLKATNE